MIQLNDPRLPSELIPGNHAEILERSKERQELWGKQIDELQSLRRGNTPPSSSTKLPDWLSFAVVAAIAGAAGLMAGAMLF